MSSPSTSALSASRQALGEPRLGDDAHLLRVARELDDGEIGSLSTTITTHEATITTHLATIATRDATIVTLESEIAVLEATLASVASDVNALLVTLESETDPAIVEARDNVIDTLTEHELYEG